MKQLFLCVLSLSLSGALTGILLLLVHPITKKYFSKKWNYYIWLLVIARLLIPVQLETGFGDGALLRSRTEAVREQSSGAQALSDTADDLEMQQIHTDSWEANLKDDQMDPAPQISVLSKDAKNAAMNPGMFAGMVWILGTVLALFIKIENYRRFSMSLKKSGEVTKDRRINALLKELTAGIAIKRRPEILESEEVSVPITMGLLKPVIVIPKEERNMADFKMVLHHELIHIKRKDLWYKWLYQTLLCMHWFNPVLYLIGRKLNEDCEFSCDEAVLADLTQEGKRAYGNMLINAAEKNIGFCSSIPSATFLERKEDLKARLTGILQYKKQTGLKILLSVCVSVGMICLTACGSVQVSPDALPFHISGESIFDSFVSFADGADVDTFLAQTAAVNKKGEAWQAYDNDELLAGEDLSDGERYYSYMGGSQIKCKGMYLNGTNSNLIVYADKPVEIGVDLSFELLAGKLKLVYIAPDGTVELLDDTGNGFKQKITLEEGRNVFKLAGQDAKAKVLNLTYTGVESSKIRTYYYSEEDEQGDILSEKAMSGEVSKEEVLDHLYYMKEESVSMALAKFLERGESLSSDEFVDLIIYSNEELSVKYIVQAAKEGKTSFMTPEMLSELMPYLNDEARIELIMAMDQKLTFEAIDDWMPYLSNDGKEKCLMKYLKEGNTLTYSQFDEISPYLNNDIINKIDDYLKEMPYHW